MSNKKNYACETTPLHKSIYRLFKPRLCSLKIQHGEYTWSLRQNFDFYGTFTLGTTLKVKINNRFDTDISVIIYHIYGKDKNIKCIKWVNETLKSKKGKYYSRILTKKSKYQQKFHIRIILSPQKKAITHLFRFKTK